MDRVLFIGLVVMTQDDGYVTDGRSQNRRKYISGERDFSFSRAAQHWRARAVHLLRIDVSDFSDQLCLYSILYVGIVGECFSKMKASSVHMRSDPHKLANIG